MSGKVVPPPPGLPPAVATFAYAKGSSLQLAVLVVAISAGYVLLRGGEFDRGIIAIMLVGVGYMALQSRQHELAAGPGWMSVRGVLRRRWVRTDQLVRVKDGASGVDRVLTLRDRDGRKVGIMAAELREAPDIRAQLAHDVRTSIADGLEVKDRTLPHLGLR